MPEPLAYLNGRFLPQAQAALPLYDAGFVLGATVTDFVRTFRHRPFRLADHLSRFRESCRLAFIAQPLSDDELTGIAEELVAHNSRLIAPGQELALVLVATPGRVGYYRGEPGGAGDGPPTLGMHTFPLPFARFRRLFREGATLTVSDRLVPPGCIDPRIKHRSRLHLWLTEQTLRRTAEADPHATPLFVVDAGPDRHLIRETPTANFLAVLDGVVTSPPREAILPGVSLRVVEELCHALGIPFAEREITTGDLGAEPDEAILANTTTCLVGVSRIMGRGVRWPGPVYQRLLATWSDLVGVDIAGQFLAVTSGGPSLRGPPF
jgi:branched-chain amino acid aminotransferase